MRTLRLAARDDLRLCDEPEPNLSPGDVRLRVTAVGLCGSDRHWFLEGGIGDSQLANPLVLGHEFAGIIESGPRAGERVAVDPAIPCGHCAPCLAGRSHLCQHMRFAGHGTTDGALRELMAWPENLMHPLPDHVSDGEGALMEALGVALHALDLGGVRTGDSVSVHGCGPIGLLLVQLVALGAPRVLIATDLLTHRIAAAAAAGATDVVLAGEPGDDAAAIDRLTHTEGVDVAFEVAGTDGAVESATRAAKPGGRVVLVGIPDEDRTAFPASVARRKGLTLLLSRRMTVADLPRAIRLVGSGRIDLKAVISERYPLSGASAAFASLRERRALKVLVEPSSGATPEVSRNGR